MKVLRSFETSLTIHQSIQHNIPQTLNFHNQECQATMHRTRDLHWIPRKYCEIVSIHTVFLLPWHSKELLTDSKRPELRCLNWTCRRGETKGGEHSNGAFTNPGYLPVYWYGHVTDDYGITCVTSGRSTSDWSHMQHWYYDTEAISELTQHNIKTCGKALVKHQTFSISALDGSEWLHNVAHNHHPAADRGTGTYRKRTDGHILRHARELRPDHPTHSRSSSCLFQNYVNIFLLLPATTAHPCSSFLSFIAHLPSLRGGGGGEQDKLMKSPCCVCVCACVRTFHLHQPTDFHEIWYATRQDRPPPTSYFQFP
jgi:hypothetical protein